MAALPVGAERLLTEDAGRHGRSPLPSRAMADDDHEQEPMQETPHGHPIPVPKREDVFGDLRRVAPPVPLPRPKRERSS